MSRAVLIAALLVLFAAPAVAYPLGSDPSLKCFPIAEKPSAMKAAAEMGAVQTFDADSSKKLIDAINGQAPATHWEATTVDVVTTKADDKPVHVFFTDAERMCLVEVATTAVWDKLADKVFGGGI